MMIYTHWKLVKQFKSQCHINFSTQYFGQNLHLHKFYTTPWCEHPSSRPFLNCNQKKCDQNGKDYIWPYTKVQNFLKCKTEYYRVESVTSCCAATDVTYFMVCSPMLQWGWAMPRQVMSGCHPAMRLTEGSALSCILPNVTTQWTN
jgi:hypothetical protein